MRQIISIKHLNIHFPFLILIAVFNLFNCEFDNLTSTLLYSIIYTVPRTFIVPL